MDDPDLCVTRCEMDVETNEAKLVKEGNLVFIERERARPSVTRGLDPFRNFNFRLVEDSEEILR